MNNELYRKLTSITLMTIMFAGGMTIAIPGELPTAVAQTGTLSVSATAAPDNSFGGPQVIEIVIDDPSINAVDSKQTQPDVTIDGNKVVMVQADTGKWYAYVASTAILADADNAAERNGITVGNVNLGTGFLATTTPTSSILSGSDAVRLLASSDILTTNVKLSDPEGTDTLAGHTLTEAEEPSWPFIQVYDITDESDIDVEYGSETIGLTYNTDLDDLASVDVDRRGVPEEGTIHVTISDFQLNLNPTAEDVWIMQANGSLTSYVHVSLFDHNDDGDATTEDSNIDNWLDNDGVDDTTTSVFAGDTGVLGITDVDTVVELTHEDNADGAIILTETGSNTGVFESQDDDESNIWIMGSENDDFTIDYAGATVQVFVESFDTTLEMIADGTWDSGDTLTVRLTDENLNINTLKDDNFGIDDSPIMRFGTPDTSNYFAPTARISDDSITVDSDTLLTTLSATTGMTAFDVALDEGKVAELNSSSVSRYIHYSGGPDLTTDGIQLLDDTDMSLVTISEGMTKIPTLATDADGKFTLTFDTTALTEDVAEANGQLQTARANAADSADEAQEARDDNDVTEAQTALDDIKTAATSIIILESLIGEGSVNMAIAGINVTLAATPADKEDLKTPEAVFAEVKEHIDNAIVKETTTFALEVFTFGAGTNDAIYRPLLEETDSASGVFEGTIEYRMLNQYNIDKTDTYTAITAAGNELVIVLNRDYTGGDAPEITFGGDNVSEDAPTNTGEVSLDSGTYRVADDVTITLTDLDLNTDSGAREIYHVTSLGTSEDVVRVTIDDDACNAEPGIGSVSLRETADDSGVFEGSFEVPPNCGTGTNSGTTGKSISVTYIDFRDENGGDSEWTDSATIGADTGSVSLDRTVYPVPPPGDDNKVTITVSVDDSDVDTSSSSTQTIESVELDIAGVLVTLDDLKETDTDSGIFEATMEIGTSVSGKDADNPDNDKSVKILQGAIITVTYEDASDASGHKNTASDSATFDLRNAVLQSDKSVYVIGQDVLITLIEADLNLNSATIDNVGLDRINWDSDAYDGSLADARAAFGPVPTNLRETGENTGIFQVVITIPNAVGDNALERGEEITLSYEDNGPSGADYVGDDTRDVELQIETSNFGATLELDQNVYTWTDKVFITVVASDYNFDSNIVDEIGTEDKGEIIIRTRASEVQYRLAETGPDTGVFSGELVLTGDKDALDDGGPNSQKSTGIAGPTDGKLPTKTEDGISVSFDYSDSEAPLVASALIRWNVGEVQWLEASYAATGSGIVRIIDPDMNINPDAVDNLDVVVYSETFIGGIDLTVTETQEASGIFEGTVEFDPESASDGHRLQVTEGDIVTAAYDDETLPKPDNGDTLEITATALIGSIVPPLERAPASNPAIVDAFGNSLASVSADQQVQITADITSGQDRDQDFAYLVQIQDEDGVTIALSWITGTLGAGATFSPSQSWTPSETGSYTATIFVWESVSNPTALSPQLSITIDVV